MKKQILALTLGLMSLGVMAQKNELKAAEKAIKKNNFSGAVTAVTAAEAYAVNGDLLGISLEFDGAAAETLGEINYSALLDS